MSSLIFIIDDEKLYCEVLGDILESYGYHVQVAHDAHSALSQLQVSKPDLILLDVMMPEMDGLSLLRRLREEPAYAQTTVIVVSAKSMADDRDAALEAGADGYLTKPYTAQELRHAVGAFLPVST